MTGWDCIIVGAGPIGMLSARELALDGTRVTLPEERTAGRQCSWAGGGILSAPGRARCKAGTDWVY